MGGWVGGWSYLLPSSAFRWLSGWVGVGGWVVYLSQVSIPVARSGERSASWREANMEE